MTDKIVVLSTCADRAEGERLGRLLVEERLAACVTVLDGATSIYRWQEKIERASECVLLIKTMHTLFTQVQAVLSKAHSYELPEIIALPVLAGPANYLGWIEECVRPSAEAGA